MDLRDLLAMEAAKDRVAQLIPDETVLGEPYWVVMKMCGGRPQEILAPPDGGKPLIVLFQSRQDASIVAAHLPDGNEMWTARGLTHRHLRVLVRSLRPEIGFGIALQVDRDTGRFAVTPLSRDEVSRLAL